MGNVAFLDLHGLVRDRFGEYEEWSETLLRDGVHPNLDGARHFASLMWREFVDACGPRSDLDRDGDVDAADFGLLLVEPRATQVEIVPFAWHRGEVVAA